MKNHHEVGHFKNRLMILLLSLAALLVMAGQSFAANCSTCHGMPPQDSSDGKRHPESGAFAGNHQKHTGADSAGCVKCHAGAAGYDNKHASTSNYRISLSSKINSYSAASYSKGVFVNQTSVPSIGSCSSVNCHFEKTGAGAPVWGAKPTVDCNFCHATPRAASGSHAKHEAKYTCDQCHPDYGTTNFSHASSAGKDKIKVNATNAYDGGTSKSWLPSQTNAFGKCTNASCHDNGRGVKVDTPVWGASSVPACSSCHEAVPTTFSHTKHLSGLAAKFNRNAVCADCHKGYVEGTTTTDDHIDGNVDVYKTLPGDLGYTANKAKGSALTTCSTSNYCHSNGKNTSFASATWGGTSTGCTFCHPTLSAGHTIHVGTLLSEISFYNYTTTSSNGSVYKFGCANCHPLTLTSHLNNSVDIDLSASSSGGHLKELNSAGATISGTLRCSNVYCHSNGFIGGSFKNMSTPVWGESFSLDRCASCHGNSPNSTIPGSSAHSAHVVGIHVDDIFNGVSKKLPIAGATSVNAAHGSNYRSTTINCNICHAGTVTTFNNDQNSECSLCHKVGGTPAPLKGNVSIAQASKHVNGKVDVIFIDQTIATKAQLAKTAFAGYTASNAGGWSRNSSSLSFKTYTTSFDVTKRTLYASADAYSHDNGCKNIACHNSRTVKWTDTNVSCVSCHIRLR